MAESEHTRRQAQRPDQERGPYPAPKEPFEVEVENIMMEVPEGEAVAPGWRPWAATDDGFSEPEYGPIELEGRRVQGIFAEHPYDVSFMQRIQVELTPGFAVTFRMRFRVDPSKAAAERTRPQGLLVGVGIDLTGGDDPRDPNVQWALRDLNYSEAVTASVTAMAGEDQTTEQITAFVRSVAFIPGSSTAAGNGAAPKCAFICARTTYARVYLLLPPGASQALWERAARTACRNNWTLGGSADDAGFGAGLLSPWPTIRAISPEVWPLTQKWFDSYYKPAVFIPMSPEELDP